MKLILLTLILTTHNSFGSSYEDMQRTSWFAVPKEYQGRTYDKWGDLDSILKGERIYSRYCRTCHGENGDGNGTFAKHLSFKPANLHNHFHNPETNAGDDYLFWHVLKGGAVEPFKSMGSMMPAFEGVLTEEQIWQVLSYIQMVFHDGDNKNLRSSIQEMNQKKPSK